MLRNYKVLPKEYYKLLYQNKTFVFNIFILTARNVSMYTSSIKNDNDKNVIETNKNTEKKKKRIISICKSINQYYLKLYKCI